MLKDEDSQLLASLPAKTSYDRNLASRVMGPRVGTQTLRWILQLPAERLCRCRRPSYYQQSHSAIPTSGNSCCCAMVLKNLGFGHAYEVLRTHKLAVVSPRASLLFRYSSLS